MPGVQAHVPFPAADADLLEKAADLLSSHKPAVSPVYAERFREKAAKIREKPFAPLTSGSSIEELREHGVPPGVITALKGQDISTVGALCELTAEDVGYINNIGRGQRRAQLCEVLAKSLMGLRPIPPK